MKLNPSPIRESKGIQELAHAQTAEEVTTALGTRAQAGLTSEEVQERRQRFGFNELRTRPRVPVWRRLLMQIHDPQIYLLLGATSVAAIVARLESGPGIPYESLIILAIVILNAVLGFIQEDRATRALDTLRKMVPVETTVIRDGQQQRLPARDLVPGDLLVLREGDSIPADARLVRVQSLITTESSLTGESLPVMKHPDPVEHSAATGDRLNMVFAGTMAISGNGQAVVTAIGVQTEFGRVAALLDTEKDQVAPLQLQLKRLSKQMGVGVVLIAACVVIALLAIHGLKDANVIMNVLLFGIALAVAATPEGLAAVITLVLAIGVQRMTRRGAIVKKLPAVETLGSTTVIASDKTGTMTGNEMTVAVIITASGRTDVSGIGYAPEGNLTTAQDEDLSDDQWAEVHPLLIGATLANNSRLDKVEDQWKIQGDPTEVALLTAARKAKIIPSTIQSLYPRLREVVFSSERKMMSTVHEDKQDPGTLVIFTKGAPDILLENCTQELVPGFVRPLSSQRRQDIHRDNEKLTVNALRTLGVATRSLISSEPFDPAVRDGLGIEHNLTFLGLVGMIDPPRPEARVAVEQARHAGIRTILITGDHPSTAVAIARSLNIVSDDQVLAGIQIEQMTDAHLIQAVRTTDVYARVNPEHKLRIVRALQQNNDIVAMTGDGVNDAPALKAAHIGIAMGVSGTDVSKDAADLILTDDNYATIVAAVEEGRIVFDNIRKFLRYLLATNLGEVLTIFLSAVILSLRSGGTTHALVLPLSAAQILWINLVTDSAPALALGVDSAAPDIMHRPPRPSDESIINRQMVFDLLAVASTMAVGTLSVFFLSSSDVISYRRSMAFTTLILFQLFNSVSARSDSESAFRNLFCNHWLWGAILLSIGLQVIILSVPLLQRAFGVVQLSRSDWMLCIAVASSVLVVSETIKYIRRGNVSTHQLLHDQPKNQASSKAIS
ncbi:cation-translocating P-type ATPase [Edaphobacter aggregans]|uniref:cation-translocating P-type ATPase n=1 Tax=Edaphobacter aggregans TaxID=570835 RepID=UPI00068BADAB|nr:cation-translocating P-type ATPase [Edaphobacter aggregans]